MVRCLLLILTLLAGPAQAQEPELSTEQARLELVLDDPGLEPVAGQMMLATIRGLYAVNITQEELKMRRMTGIDWIRLGQDEWSQQRIGGRSLRVMERRVALFPKADGALTILPIAHELEYTDGGERRRAIVRSEPVTLTVREAPVGEAEDWLPARAVEISESWSADASQLTDGQSVERRVILRVFGATPEMLPTQPPLRAPWLITFSPPEERSQQLTPQGPVTTVIWHWTLRPTTGELGVLPAVTIPWYDTDASEARTVTIPAASIGYQSFADNSASAWNEGFAGGYLALLAWGLSGAIALLALVVGSGTVAAPVSVLRQRLERRRLRRSLSRAARERDAAGFRAAAVAMLSGGGRKGNVREYEVLASLDEQVFGPPEDNKRPQLDALYKAILRRPTR